MKRDEQDKKLDGSREILQENKKYEDSKETPEKDESKCITKAKYRRDDLVKYESLMLVLNDEVRDVLDEVFAEMRLKADMRSCETGTRAELEECQKKNKLICVEGSSDREFYGCYVKDGVFIEDISGLLEAYNCLKLLEEKQIHKETILSHKEMVIELIKALTLGEGLGVDIPAEITDNYDIYGIIDKDFDGDNKYSFYDRLFVTDTHDFETLMLSTDAGVVYRLKDYRITEDEYQKALYIAYQLGIIKQILQSKEMSKHTHHLSIKNLSINAKELKSNPRINLSTVIATINDCVDKENEGKERRDRISKITKTDEDDLNRKFDKDKYKTLDSFNRSLPPKLWEVSNGHDIVDALNLIKDCTICDRDFINAYDKGKFYETDIAQSMQEACLI